MSLSRASAAHRRATHRRTSEATAARTARTAHGVTVHRTEAPGQGNDDVAAQGVVEHLGVVVRVVRHHQVLGLAEDVIALYGQGHLPLEQQFLQFGVQDVFRRLLGRVAAVPVVVEIALERQAARSQVQVRAALSGLVMPDTAATCPFRVMRLSANLGTIYL